MIKSKDLRPEKNHELERQTIGTCGQLAEDTWIVILRLYWGVVRFILSNVALKCIRHKLISFWFCKSFLKSWAKLKYILLMVIMPQIYQNISDIFFIKGLYNLSPMLTFTWKFINFVYFLIWRIPIILMKSCIRWQHATFTKIEVDIFRLQLK